MKNVYKINKKATMGGYVVRNVPRIINSYIVDVELMNALFQINHSHLGACTTYCTTYCKTPDLYHSLLYIIITHARSPVGRGPD